MDACRVHVILHELQTEEYIKVNVQFHIPAIASQAEDASRFHCIGELVACGNELEKILFLPRNENQSSSMRPVPILIELFRL
jgi:hypothetical protein